MHITPRRERRASFPVSDESWDTLSQWYVASKRHRLCFSVWLRNKTKRSVTELGVTYVNVRGSCARQQSDRDSSSDESVDVNLSVICHTEHQPLHTLAFERWENESVSAGIWNRISKCLVGCKYKLCFPCSRNFASIIRSMTNPLKTSWDEPVGMFPQTQFYPQKKEKHSNRCGMLNYIQHSAKLFH